MGSHKTLNDFEEQIRDCVRCGACQAHCAVYGELRREGGAARGKVALACALLDGRMRLEKRLAQDMALCLLCGSCVDKCPNKVPTDQIVMAARRSIAGERGRGLLGRGISAVLGRRNLMRALAKGGAKTAPLLMKHVPESSGLRLRFPSPLMKNRTLPPVTDNPFLDRHPEVIRGDPGKARVGFFTGCSINYMYPEIGEALITVLGALGFTLVLPKAQGCCGIPALSNGDGKQVERLAEANVNAFALHRVDHIVTACASCLSGAGHYYRTMAADYSGLSDKMIDIHVFLIDQGLAGELASLPQKEHRARVTYHDPCHLRSRGIIKEPREVLKALPTVDFVEMTGAARCCGLGGTFSVYHYDTSKDIGARKIPGIKESGAEIIATGCPGCIMQLQDTINHHGLRVKTRHTLELVSEALKELSEKRLTLKTPKD